MASDWATALLEQVPEPAGAVIPGRPVSYRHDGVELEGFVASDEATNGARPGVLVLHDWEGLDEYEQTRCRMLARLGYVAFGADLFGAGVRPHGDEAAQVARRFYADPALLRGRAAAGLAQLRALPHVDSERLAVIGYCFGGHAALELARTGAELVGVVSFHGALQPTSTEDAAALRAKVLVLTGADDPVVPDEAVTAFMSSMRAEPSLDWQLTSYSGATHAFTIPTAAAPGRAQYSQRADRRSWVAMRSFLDEIFAV